MSSPLRVTDRSIATSVLAGLQGNLSKLGTLQQQLSSGKQINLPSDSPAGTTSAMLLRSDIHTLQQYGRNADDGIGWLGTLDGTLTNVVQQVQQARDITLQGMSNGAGGSPSARAALADQIDALRQSLLGDANTKYLNRPVFGGTTAGTDAYDTSGTYVGDNGIVNRTVGDGDQVQVNLTGPQVFGPPGGDLFTVLASISSDLRSNPSGLTNDLNQLDTATNTIITQQGNVGARYSRVQQMQQTANDRILTLQTQLSDTEDIDLPKTIMDLQLQQTAYQAALSATAKVIQPSLVDFLK